MIQTPISHLVDNPVDTYLSVVVEVFNGLNADDGSCGITVLLGESFCQDLVLDSIEISREVCVVLDQCQIVSQILFSDALPAHLHRERRITLQALAG